MALTSVKWNVRPETFQHAAHMALYGSRESDDLHDKSFQIYLGGGRSIWIHHNIIEESGGTQEDNNRPVK
jgi:hypothetical protein